LLGGVSSYITYTTATDELHWLDVTERIQFRVATTVYRCLHGMAPAYLAELCLPITESASRRGGLRSAWQPGHTALQTVNLRHPCL